MYRLYYGRRGTPYFFGGEEDLDNLFPLQKPNKQIIMKQRLAFKHNLSQAIVDVGKQVRTGAGLTGYDNTFSTLP